MTNLSRFRRGWSYPVVAGVLAGTLLAGLAFRLSVDVPSTSTAGSTGFGSGTDVRTDDGSNSAATDSSTAAGATGTVTGAGDSVPGATAGAPSAPSGTGGAGATLTASDVGVTASTIKVGVAILTAGGAAAFVPSGLVPTPDEQRAGWQAFIDEANNNGGVLGRKIVPYYQDVTPTDASSQQAACRTWTQTNRVFAVFDAGAVMGAGQLCITAENHTIDIGGFQAYSPSQTYRKAGGLLITQAANGTRVMADWARALQHLGKLSDRTLGLIVDQGDGQTVANEGLVPVLRSMGYKITYTAVVSSDPSQGPTQASTHVTQMRAAGVDMVLVATGFVNMTAFMNQADKQQWKPLYAVSQWSGQDVGQFNDSYPASFIGAIGITYYGFSSPPHGEEPTSRGCRERFNKLTGSNVRPQASNRFIAQYCTHVNLLVTAAKNAGPELTRARFIAAVQGLGSSWSYGWLGGSFSPGKTDWADNVRPVVWGPSDGSSDNCTLSGSKMCWNDAGPAFNPSR
jgi:ABC-type branched-subunit amino acid transport system substrate-binding protein